MLSTRVVQRRAIRVVHADETMSIRKFALQLLCHGRYLGKCVRREQTHRTTNERLYGAPHAFLLCDHL